MATHIGSGKSNIGPIMVLVTSVLLIIVCTAEADELRTPNKTNTPSLTKLTRVGCFGLQHNSHYNNGKNRIGYSSGIFHYAKNKVYFASHGHTYTVAEFTIPDGFLNSTPTDKPIAKQSGPWTDITKGKMPEFKQGKVLSGFALINNKWAWMGREYYNADSSIDVCFGYDGSDPIQVGPHSQRTAGFLVSHNNQLYCGLSGITNHQQSGHGPSIYRFPFDPAIPPKASIKAEEIIHHPMSNPHDSWNHNSGIRGCVIRGKYAILFGWVGKGQIWYGSGKTNPKTKATDPCSGSQGFHSEGSEPYAWIINIPNGKVVEHGSIRSVLGKELVHPCAKIQCAGYDANKDYIFLSVTDYWRNAGMEPRPMVFVMKFAE